MTTAAMAVTAVTTAGCSYFQSPCTDDELVRVAVSVSPETNAGHGVLVRVFLLKSDAAFTSADFEDLTRGDVGTMKEDAVATKEAVIVSGQKETMFEFSRGKDAAVRSLGVFAAMEPRQGTWRLTRKLAPPNPTAFCHAANAGEPVRINLTGQEMAFATGGPKT